MHKMANTAKPGSFCFQVQDDSLLPRFRRGDYLFARRVSLCTAPEDHDARYPGAEWEALQGRPVVVLLGDKRTVRTLDVLPPRRKGERYRVVLKPLNGKGRFVERIPYNCQAAFGFSISSAMPWPPPMQAEAMP